MKKLPLFIVLVLIAASCFAQGKAMEKDLRTKQVADSIRNNEPLLSRNEVYVFIQETITGYMAANGQSIKSKFADAILVEDAFNGQQCNIIIDYAVRVIAADLTRLLNEAEAKKERLKK